MSPSSSCPKCGAPQPRGLLCAKCGNTGPPPKSERFGTRRERLRKKAERASNTTRSVALMRCFNGHMWRAEVDPHSGLSSKEFTCPTCGEESAQEDILKVKITGAKCRARCWTATNPFVCICSCAGANHGKGGPPVDEDATEQVA